MQMRRIAASNSTNRRRGRQDIDQTDVRPANGFAVGIVLEGHEKVTENEMRKLPLAKSEEGAVRKRAAGCAMDELRLRTRIDAGNVQGNIQSFPVRLQGSVADGPTCEELPIVIPPALAARPMARSQSDSLI
jgi:hypothetical protein